MDVRKMIIAAEEFAKDLNAMENTLFGSISKIELDTVSLRITLDNGADFLFSIDRCSFRERAGYKQLTTALFEKEEESNVKLQYAVDCLQEKIKLERQVIDEHKRAGTTEG